MALTNPPASPANSTRPCQARGSGPPTGIRNGVKQRRSDRPASTPGRRSDATNRSCSAYGLLGHLARRSATAGSRCRRSRDASSERCTRSRRGRRTRRRPRARRDRARASVSTGVSSIMSMARLERGPSRVHAEALRDHAVHAVGGHDDRRAQARGRRAPSSVTPSASAAACVISNPRDHRRAGRTRGVDERRSNSTRRTSSTGASALSRSSADPCGPLEVQPANPVHVDAGHRAGEPREARRAHGR